MTVNDASIAALNSEVVARDDSGDRDDVVVKNEPTVTDIETTMNGVIDALATLSAMGQSLVELSEDALRCVAEAKAQLANRLRTRSRSRSRSRRRGRSRSGA